EGEDQAAWIESELALERQPVTSAALPANLEPTPEGWVRTHPGMLPELGGLDGFFVARFSKS
ncbi:MAG: SAM-dependent methyltransferase, partial [Pseudomonadota bacterium]